MFPFRNLAALVTSLNDCLGHGSHLVRAVANYFIYDCLSHGSHLVNAVANCGIQCGLHNSFFGRNASFGARRYNCRNHDISSDNVNAQHMINNYVDNLSVDRHLQVACFVHELVSLRRSICKSSDTDLCRDELEQLINVVSTS
jgi:hypothetical protein